MPRPEPRVLALLVILAAGVVAAATQAPPPPPPAWAYPAPTQGVSKPEPSPNQVFRMPGAARTYAWAEIDDFFHAADWRPAEHPTLPEVVAHGRKPDLYACGYCHLPNGQGRPENASLAGLTAPYIVEQVQEMAAGRRRAAIPGRLPQTLMTRVATRVRPGELKTAAAYFSKLTYRPWIRVVETAEVPRTTVGGPSTYDPIPHGGVEPLGQRIIEVPESPERTAARDTASGFIAYAPKGAVARGAALVQSGGPGGVPCAVCHGVGLKGQGDVPRLAGRSPSYLARQLFDIRSGSRRGPAVALMQGPAGKLSDSQVIDLAAYAASLR
jgi:cytochrome c553